MYIHVQILKLVNFVLEFSLFVITILKYKMHWVRRWNYVSDLFLLMLYQFEGIAGLYIPPPSSFKKPSIPSFKFFSSLFFAGNQIFSWGGVAGWDENKKYIPLLWIIWRLRANKSFLVCFVSFDCRSIFLKARCEHTTKNIFYIYNEVFRCNFFVKKVYLKLYYMS